MQFCLFFFPVQRPETMKYSSKSDCVRQPVMSFASITAVVPISLKGV